MVYHHNVYMDIRILVYTSQWELPVTALSLCVSRRIFVICMNVYVHVLSVYIISISVCVYLHKNIQQGFVFPREHGIETFRLNKWFFLAVVFWFRVIFVGFVLCFCLNTQTFSIGNFFLSVFLANFE